MIRPALPGPKGPGRQRSLARLVGRVRLDPPLVLALVLCLSPGHAFAQEAQTRAEILARERADKAKQLEAPRPGGLERGLLALENDRILERLLNPAEGFYPKIGNITPGSGFAVGPAYRAPNVLGDELHVSAFGMASIQKYWLLEARVDAPDLAADRVFFNAYVRRYDYPEEDFFGLGPNSLREAHSTYGLRSTDVGGAAGVRLTPWFSLGSTIDFLTPSVSVLADQPDFIRAGVTAEVNTREPRGNPRQGARYALAYQRFDARRSGSLPAVAPPQAGDFDRVEVDLQQYISLYRNRRVLALRGFVSSSDAPGGGEVPFYYMRTLGGPDDLRGFRQFRFRDRNVLLLQAEYRWEIFTAMDGAIFYDAGKVASRFEDLNFRDLESDDGIGFRFGTRNGVFLRVEGAFGSSGGAHFVMRFGHVF